jgi:phenylpyruvate tautomerase PptA (4-oxalocrotonate tautomerase family)
MPILDVEVVGPMPAARRRGLARRLAGACGAAFGAPPGHTWVRLRWLAADDYAESGGGPPRGVRPVFVGVLLAERPPIGVRTRQAAGVAAAVAVACGRPVANVHVLFHAPAKGRIAFGGRLVHKA